MRIALGEYDTGWHDPVGSLERAAGVVARAANAGARLVVLPEMSATGFTMDVEQADAWDGTHVERLARAAREHSVWVIAGLALREDDRAVNVAVALDPRGEVVAAYRKQRLFAFAGEHRSYAPGAAPLTLDVEGVRVSPFVCYDLRFPELFREVAAGTDLFVLIANWPAARRSHWDILVRARAVENLAYMAAVNRTGEGGGLAYDGGSVAYGPWGDALPEAGPRIVDVDPGEVARVRAQYPFLADRLAR
jgi:predicted amidohydrolase